MIELNDAIVFFQSNRIYYFSLWAFYFMVSAGILGFVYGNKFARKSIIAKTGAFILYIMVVKANSMAILSTHDILYETKTEIKSVIYRSYPIDSKMSLTKVDFRKIYNKLQLTERRVVKNSYMTATILVIIGIWFSNIIRFIEKYIDNKYK